MIEYREDKEDIDICVRTRIHTSVDARLSILAH